MKNQTPFSCMKCKHTFADWWSDRDAETSDIKYEDETCPNCGSDEICGHNDDDDAPIYVCTWGAGFPNTYPDIIQVEEPSFFATTLGYSTEQINGIMQLEEGESYRDLDGGHFVMRATNGFNPKESL